jgi:tRNA-splicing ligase RtcB
MITKDNLIKISPVLWEIPISFRADMRVPARIFATEQMLADVFSDKSLEQLVNTSTLQGVIGAALAMPDAHEGYGFPIGGVVATKFPDGIISPGGIGYDINCGVRLLRSQLFFKDVKDKLEHLSLRLYHEIPAGVGSSGAHVLSEKELDKVLREGVKWALEKNFANQSDIFHIESGGKLETADPSLVSPEAKKRGHDQLGTLGSGNHFAEVDIVEELYDAKTAQAFGLSKDQIVILIHTGSRGLGHQIATDYIRLMLNIMCNYNIKLPDRELACVPFSSKEGQEYFKAMSAAANFAWANRQLITHQIRTVWNKEFGDSSGGLSLVYDLAHNIAKIETHDINGKKQKVIVHRKGATRAFGPEHPDLAPEYRTLGQPVIIPGSMGTASYVLVGTSEGMKLSFGSSCHGAGRKLSRHAAKRTVHGKTLRQELYKSGIVIQCDSHAGLAEEAPLAYKNIDDVVDVVHQAGIARKVAKLKPVIVIKGG